MSRRYRTNQANVRSTTHRRAWIWNPAAAFAVIVTFHRQAVRTNSWNRLLKPLSAITSRTRASRCRTPANNHRPPSRSWTSAVVTSKAHTSPSESTPTNRLRPFVFFPPVVPFRAAAMSRFDRLAIDPQGFRGRRGANFQSNFLPQGGVEFLPGAVESPVAELAVHRLPRRKVVGEHPPGAARSQVVEDGIDHLAEFAGRGPSALGRAGFWLGEQRFETLPLVVGQVGGVGLPAHGRQRNIPTPSRRDRFQNTLLEPVCEPACFECWSGGFGRSAV